MTVPTPRIALTLYGDPNAPEVKAAIEVLDRSGLSYMMKAAAAPDSRERPGASPSHPVVTWEDERLSGFSHRELVDFLWAHGAKFEDS